MNAMSSSWNDSESLIPSLSLVQARFPLLSSSGTTRFLQDRRLARIIGFLLTCLLSLSFYLSNFTSRGFSRVYQGALTSAEVERLSIISYKDIVDQDDFEFELDSQDVLVFLHIQKTGGTTFGKHLVQDIDLEKPCICRQVLRKPKKLRKKNKKRRKQGRLKCDCLRPGHKNEHWLFSRYSTGWKCGVHSDWTELTECVDKYLKRTENQDDLNEEYGEDDYEDESEERRYFYITFLRDPIDRYLSEYRHVRRGATWRGDTHTCRGLKPTPEELPPCYDTEDWTDVTLEEFMNCSSNLAANRQTWMLADLRLVDCYNRSVPNRDKIMLESAKFNLEHRFAYFGLTEMQSESQLLFEDTFGLSFFNNFTQMERTTADKEEETLDEATLERVARINYLDVQLYKFAKDLMQRRVSEVEARSQNSMETDIGT